MEQNGVVSTWARSLGLFDIPLFPESYAEPGTHFVLLNGGAGSFAVSSHEEAPIDAETAANWAWSADVPHHVSVNREKITLSRWDDPAATRQFVRQSVEVRLQSFYDYLLLDRVRSRFDIVAHSIDIFRRIRSHVHSAGISDDGSIPAFLYVLGTMLDEDAEAGTVDIVERYSLEREYQKVYNVISGDVLRSFIEQFRLPVGAPRSLEVVPRLLMRHAAGTIFQDAHFEFLQGGSLDLFGLPDKAEVSAVSRGGTHFTPPGLARAIVEQALDEVGLQGRIIILDPACGAGAFLQEAVRYLQRKDYRGEIHLLGYDISANAVQMARFALAPTCQGYANLNVHVDIRVADSIGEECEWPAADVILMNPPFVAWGTLSPIQRNQVKRLLGPAYSGRPDYSMAFIEKAVLSVTPGGAVATLMPAGILSITASQRWRHHLLEAVSPRYLGVLGDHSLFRNAIVEAAYAIFIKRPAVDDDRLMSIWTSEQRGSAGEAIRHLRQFNPTVVRESGLVPRPLQADENWKISLTTADYLMHTPDWRPRPNRLERVLGAIERSIPTRVSDVFHVREGIRTGARKIFVLSARDYANLPNEERPYFRPIAENKNIREGRILAPDYIFYPHGNDLAPIASEEDLHRLVPQYYRLYLRPHREQLAERVGLSGRDWWLLNRHRTWLESNRPKLVSAFFGRAGSFAWDKDGDYVVVQGFGWIMSGSVSREIQGLPAEVRESYRDEVQFAYLALLNSTPFELLLAEFCPHVAGGQLNFSKRFVDRVPIPNLAALGRENPVLGTTIRQLSLEGQRIHTSGLAAVSPVNLARLVADAYRIPLNEWPEGGL
jgi:hypothetical protein